MTHREFIVAPGGETVMASPAEVLTNMGISPEQAAAYDICEAAGFDMEQTTPLLYAAEQDGQNPEAFARHLVKLRQAARAARRL